jgi:hypothetical protein
MARNASKIMRELLKKVNVKTILIVLVLYAILRTVSYYDDVYRISTQYLNMNGDERVLMRAARKSFRDIRESVDPCMLMYDNDHNIFRVSEIWRHDINDAKISITVKYSDSKEIRVDMIWLPQKKDVGIHFLRAVFRPEEISQECMIDANVSHDMFMKNGPVYYQDKMTKDIRLFMSNIK